MRAPSISTEHLADLFDNPARTSFRGADRPSIPSELHLQEDIPLKILDTTARAIGNDDQLLS
jgi:hypothetical protein